VTELYVLQNEILGYKPQFHHGSGPEVDDDDDDDGSTFLCCTLLHSTESSNFILTSEFTCEVYYLADKTSEILLQCQGAKSGYRPPTSILCTAHVGVECANHEFWLDGFLSGIEKGWLAFSNVP